jgi:methionyl-tRNA formyltransferase
LNTPSLNIIFAGTPAFAAVALTKLLQSPHRVVAVYTQPDRPSGRGLKLTPSAVKTVALQHQLPVHQPISLKDEMEQAILNTFNADVMVVAAYGMLLPAAVLTIPRLGCVNIHPSLLPRWRGAAPIQRTIFAGDKMTGVTIMQMDVGLDTGPMYLQHQYALDVDETSHTLHDKLAVIGADSLLETLNLLADNKIIPVAQDNALATYAKKITKEEALIDWTQSAVEIDCQIRAFNPWPIAYTRMGDHVLRIGKARVRQATQTMLPGTICHASEEGIDVVTGDGILTLLAVQLPGGKMLAIADFYHARATDYCTGKQFT